MPFHAARLVVGGVARQHELTPNLSCSDAVPVSTLAMAITTLVDCC